MATAAFKKEDLVALVDGDEDGNLEGIEDRIVGASRWSINHRAVFKDKASGKFYEVHYSRGATEQQDEAPFEYEDDLIECDEVRPAAKVVIAYERVPAEEPPVT